MLRFAGFLLLIQVLSFAIGFNAFLRPLLEGDFLTSIANNRTGYMTGLLMEFIAAPCFIGYTAIFLPYFKKLNAPLADWYWGLRIVEFGIVIVSTACLLSLFSLAQGYGSDPMSVQPLGDVILSARTWSMTLLLFVFAINSFAFAYFLFKLKLIPKLLSVSLFVTATILLIGQLLVFYGTDLKDAVIIPIVLWEVITALWLIVKGGNTASVAATN